MPQQTVNQIYYIVAWINECAARWGISSAEAYRYLHEHGGIAFLIDCYEAEHQLSIDDAVDDLALVCRNNGGTRP